MPRLSMISSLHSTRQATDTVCNLLGAPLHIQIRTATKKASTYRARKTKTKPSYLGPKRREGSFVNPANVILTQRGFSYHPGFNTYYDKRYSIYASAPGRVRFHYNPINDRNYVSVDNGDIPPLYSLKCVKYIVGEKVDAEKYLNSTTDEKMKHVNEKIEEFIGEYREEVAEFYKNRAMNKRTRKCNLLDLSLL